MSETTERLASPLAPPLWRSLAEREGSAEFREWLNREFPERASEWAGDDTSRRDFLRLMAASLAMAGAAGCVRQPREAIVPAVETPEHAPGGPPLYYATAMPMSGGGLGVLVESHDGRPTKIEGNELHPASLGATDIFAQGAVLGLYDPDRSQVVRRNGQISNWDILVSQLILQRDQAELKAGRGLRILSPPILSPTLAWQRAQLLDKFPEAQWHEYDPVNDDTVRSGAQLAFGEVVQPLYHFEQADVILSIDADFLGFGPARIRSAREFATRRKPSTDGNAAAMCRLYAVESTPSLTGSKADHRLPLSPKQIEFFTRVLATRLGLEVTLPAGGDDLNVPDAWWDALIEDLTDDSRRPMVVTGPWQPPQVHALVHMINDRLGAVGQTVTYVERPESAADANASSLAALVEDMRSGNVDSLIILDGNPAFTAPAELEFVSALEQVPFRLHMGLEQDETAALCTWHVPSTHFLEEWSDVRAFDGTVSIVQPLIDPLYRGHNRHDLLNVLLEQTDRSAYDTIRQFWQEQYAGEDFTAFWQQALHDGVIPETSFAEKEVRLRDELLAELNADTSAAATQDAASELTVVFRPHPTIWDGRFANNAWLQELPQPFTKLTWSNAALISPASARENGLADGDVVSVSADDRSIDIPVKIVPGQADRVLTLHFGHGRERAGRVGTGLGTNVYPLRTTDGAWARGVQLSKSAVAGTRTLPTTQHHFLMDGRDLVRSGTLDEYLSDPAHPPFMQAGHGPAESSSLYPEGLMDGEYQWGMSIDLTACIGCNACTIACQAENNIPTVGPKEVAQGREMHWIRVDTYFEGEPENPQMYHQPVPCMHCERAPCEPVCPVTATTHSEEGLNEMTYNRCIGTRYCSNNCPYKVRRFNFFDYHEQTRELPVLHLMQNPDVTVRSRGVMEKCTYCVQRINSARIQSKIEGRPIRDGDVVTACQAVCPTNAIIFGDIRDPDTVVSREKAKPLNYSLLEELGTIPRTTYLAAVRNPHPRLKGADK